MALVRIKSGREKTVLNRHPWIFSGAIAQVEGQPQVGDIVNVVSHRGEFLARGAYSPHSQITVRLLTWIDEPIDRAFYARRLAAAIDRRQRLIDDPATDAYRLIFAESDGLPGLIVDRYGQWLVLQALSAGAEAAKPILAELLMEMIEPKGIYERSDAEVRGQEGLPQIEGPLLGQAPPQTVVIQEHGLRFGVNMMAGHKTGFYLDQRENRQIITGYCEKKEVLNAFSYTGGFGVYAAAASASRVTNMDTSASALEAARENMALNGLDRPGDEYTEADAFRALRRYRDQARQFDMIVLDPPKFAYSRRQVRSATRGYKDINMLGMRLLRPGGILCTFSCSGLVNEDLFQKVLFGAAVDVRREVRILCRLSQGSDHPVLLTFPEGAYLKGFVCRVE